MSDTGLILKAIEFIEDHLTEEITVADVAESVSFSLYHFSRTFSRATRHSPYDYLMRRRLCEAARLLLDSDEKIIDIAYKFQFNAPETFSRTFKRMFNLQPRQVKSQQCLDQRQLMTRLTPEYLEFLSGDIALKPEAKKIPSIQIAGIAAQIDILDPNSAISALWNLLRNEIQSGMLESENRDYYGIMMFSQYCPGRPIMYMAGVSLMESEKAPSFFVQKNIPAMDYACFKLSAQANAAYFTRNYIYHTWWPKATNSPLAMFEIEFFSDQFDFQSMPLSVPHPKLLCFPLA